MEREQQGQPGDPARQRAATSPVRVGSPGTARREAHAGVQTMRGRGGARRPGVGPQNALTGRITGSRRVLWPRPCRRAAAHASMTNVRTLSVTRNGWRRSVRVRIGATSASTAVTAVGAPDPRSIECAAAPSEVGAATQLEAGGLAWCELNPHIKTVAPRAAVRASQRVTGISRGYRCRRRATMSRTFTTPSRPSRGRSWRARSGTRFGAQLPSAERPNLARAVAGTAWFSP
jgi:hypothetical protein